jgi:hypothetical protein
MQLMSVSGVADSIRCKILCLGHYLLIRKETVQIFYTAFSATALVFWWTVSSSISVVTYFYG